MRNTRKQKGISLLEIMIALSIGIVLILVIGALMVAANNASKQRSTSELMDEAARQVFSRLENDLRRAGYVDTFSNADTLKNAYGLEDAQIMARYARQEAVLTAAAAGSGTTGGTPAPIDPLEVARRTTLMGQVTNGETLPIVGCNEAFTGNPDAHGFPACADVVPSTRQSIQIAYQAIQTAGTQQFSSTSTVAQEAASESGMNRTCLNQAPTVDQPVIVNRYYVDIASGETGASFYCNSAVKSLNPGGRADPASAAARNQPLTAGVEQMVFRYLVTPADATPAASNLDFGGVVSGRSVTEYLDARAVSALPLGWASVVGVEVCVVIAASPLDGSREGDVPVLQNNIPSCLRNNNGTSADSAWAADSTRSPGDSRLYRRFVRTISIPNSLYLVPTI